jgi:RNA polymerase subunit RPABC4/transcription elongation factor Spt4
MSRKDSNTLGLTILILVFLAAFLFVNPLFRYSCSRIFMHDFLGMHPGNLTTGVFLVDHGLAQFLPLTILFFLWAAVALWVYRDAERRNHSGLLWGLFVFVGNIIGLVIYLILRSSSPDTGVSLSPAATAACPKCGGAIRDSYVACPHCGTTLSKSCPRCGKRAEPDWKVCPHCGEPLTRPESTG